MEVLLLNRPLKGIRVARIAATSFSTSTQLLPQLVAISQAGAQLTVMTSEDEWSEPLFSLDFCDFKSTSIHRDIHLFSDLISLFRLWRFFMVNRFDIVHSISPKAGLLTAIAGKLAGVPVRLHTYTGQPWVTRIGFKRSILKWCDRLIGRLNTRCYADSFSQRDFLIHQGVGNPSKLKVLGRGSLAGIDLARFSPEKYSIADKIAFRAALGLTPDTQIILFVGRVTRDKGIHELFSAFKNILCGVESVQDAVLLVVGSFEGNIEASIRAEARLLCGDKVIFTGFTRTPEQFMAIADILCIPSYREGFGTVVIEAAAMGLPTIGTRIYGLIDAIEEGETGLLVDPKNIAQLTAAMTQLLVNSVLRAHLGEQAKNRAILEFDSRQCSALVVREYQRILQ